MKGGDLKNGLSSKEPVGQKELRKETANGQRPVKPSSSVKTDRGTFKIV